VKKGTGHKGQGTGHRAQGTEEAARYEAHLKTETAGHTQFLYRRKTTLHVLFYSL